MRNIQFVRLQQLPEKKSNLVVHYTFKRLVKGYIANIKRRQQIK